LVEYFKHTVVERMALLWPQRFVSLQKQALKLTISLTELCTPHSLWLNGSVSIQHIQRPTDGFGWAFTSPNKREK
jgi:hypothetical protein